MCYRPRIWRVVLFAAPALVLAACASTTPPPSPAKPAEISASAAVSGPATSPAAPAPSSASATPTAGGLPEVHDPGQVTGHITGPCHTTGTYPDQLPDPRCTPGSIDPAVTQADIHQTICVRGYTAKVRPPEAQTEALKYGDAYPAYGVAHSIKTELDHQVPLELGGSNDAKNLWPEPETSIPNAKDYVEDAANAAVCDGRMALAAAQVAIAKNWVALGQQLNVTTPPSARATQAAAPPVLPAVSAPAAAPVTHAAAAPASSCHPTTSGGNCYRAGELCPKKDRGLSGVASGGQAITCKDDSGHWRWL